MPTNAIDLTTIAAVKSWVGISSGTTGDDSQIQDIITAFSAQVLRWTGRGTQDGSFPTVSPFTSVVSYTETYDGSGTLRQPIRNWPITSVTSLNVNGQSIPQSTSVNVWGWVIDGDAKFISMRGGYPSSNRWSPRYQGAVGLPGFCDGIQNVAISYTAGFSTVPLDLEMAARKTCALYYKRRGWIGQRSQAMAQGAGSVFFDSSEVEQDVMRTILYYQRRTA